MNRAEPAVGSLSHALRNQSQLVRDSWAHRFERSMLRIPRPVDPKQHDAMIAGLLEALAEATLDPEAKLRPGAAEVRELEKATTFAGAGMFSSGASGFDVAALVMSLRDAAVEFAPSEQIAALEGLFEWLLIVALEGFASAGVITARERADDQLEAGTPVLLVTADVPAVLLVGAPGASTLDGVLARAMLLVVRTGAKTLILDVTGLAEVAAATALEALDRFAAHPRLTEVEVALVGAPDGEQWQRVITARGARASQHERFDTALALALDRAGYQIVRRR